MTDDELRKLAEAALKDDEICAHGEWESRWDGSLGHASVTARERPGSPTQVQIAISRHGFGIPFEGQWIAAARTREPELARAVLRLLEEKHQREEDERHDRMDRDICE
jgi:hypothetical protein